MLKAIAPFAWGMLLACCSSPHHSEAVRHVDLEVEQDSSAEPAADGVAAANSEGGRTTVQTETRAAQQSAANQDRSPYEIFGDQGVFASAGKVTFDVRLPAAAEESEVRRIATEIRDSDASDRSPVFVNFYLPGQQVDDYAYAVVIFRYGRGIEVNVGGVTPSQKARMVATKPSDVLIGRWFDSNPLVGAVISITSDLRMETAYKDGSVAKRKMRERKTARGRRFDYVPAGRDYYVLLPSGDLEIRDNEGLISVARKMRR